MPMITERELARLVNPTDSTWLDEQNKLVSKQEMISSIGLGALFSNITDTLGGYDD